MSVRLSLTAWAILLPTAPFTAAQGPVRLREAFPAGYQFHVNSRVELTGELKLSPEGDKPAPPPVEVRGRSTIDYDERILDAGTPDRPPPRTLRIYRRVELERTVGDRPQESTLRPAVRRLVLLRHGHRAVPFSPDGPLTWGEIDLVSKDVFTPALAALLPERAVSPGDRWPAGRAAVEELTSLEQVEGGLECRFEGVTAANGRRLARVRLAGSVRGVSEDGPNRQQFDGYFDFDLDSNHLSSLSLEGVRFLLDQDGREAGRVKGQFVLARQVHAPSPELRDEALRGLTLEPTPDNTLLFYDNPELGVRFLYPRRWRVGLVRGRQVTLDEATGSGLLMTVEPPANVPTAAAYLEESRAYLVKQQAKFLRAEPPRQVQGPPNELEWFGLEVERGGRRERLDYYVARQPAGGAALAARLVSSDLAALQRDVERIARSVRVAPTAVRPQPVPPPGK